VAVILVLFSRRPEAFANPQFWAEDGAIFYVQADVRGWAALTIPYAGYHHFALRLVAALAVQADPAWVPASFYGASVALLAGVCLALFSPRIPLGRKPVLALCLVVIPHTGEALCSLTDAPWVLAFGLILLLLASDATTPAQWLLDLAAAVLIGLTNVFSILLLPCFAWRALSRRSVASLVLLLVVAMTAGIQAWTIIHTVPAAPGTAWAGFTPVMLLYARRIWGSLLLPPAWGGHPHTVLPLLVASAGTVGLGLAAVGGRAAGHVRVLLWCAALAVFAATVYRFRGELAAFDGCRNGDRYFFIPKVLLGWLLVQELDSAANWRRHLGRVAICAVAFSSATVWRYDRFTDYHWRDWAARIRAGEKVVVPVNPAGFSFQHPGKRHH
jgi:hypothetical protein